jgi:dual specificity phosphatase 12
MWAAMQEPLLQELGVTHILGCTSYGDSIRFFPDDFKYLVITLDDIPESDLSVHFEQTTNFIKECEETKGKILVHCAQGWYSPVLHLYALGRSRSATIILAYLMMHHKMRYTEALKLVQERRPQCNPNPGFQV